MSDGALLTGIIVVLSLTLGTVFAINKARKYTIACSGSSGEKVYEGAHGLDGRGFFGCGPGMSFITSDGRRVETTDRCTAVGPRTTRERRIAEPAEGTE